MEKTFVMIKPDAVQRGLVGEVIGRFEQKGLKLVACKMDTLSTGILKAHYAHLAKEPFFPKLVKFMQSGPVVMMCWEGLDAVEVVRSLCGVTNSRKAAAGTIRGDLSMSVQANVVHASDSVKTAKAELARMFKRSELFKYEKAEFVWTYSVDERA